MDHRPSPCRCLEVDVGVCTGTPFCRSRACGLCHVCRWVGQDPEPRLPVLTPGDERFRQAYLSGDPNRLRPYVTLATSAEGDTRSMDLTAAATRVLLRIGDMGVPL